MAESPTRKKASVASKNGAPRIAPTPISPAAAAPVPTMTAPSMATMGIIVSGSAVPTAARRLPTAPWPRFRRSPMISTAFVKSAAAPSIAASATMSSIIDMDSTPSFRGKNVLDSWPVLYPDSEEMDHTEKILAAVADGELSVAAAAGRLNRGAVLYLDEFAALDLGRSTRKGVPEVVYARGKSPEQVASICAVLLESCERVIVSTPTPEHESKIHATLPEIPLRQAGRSVVLGVGEPSPSGGRLGALSAGTSDLPVLEEALAVAREMGVSAKSFHDVGVAGVHRLAAPLEELRTFDPDVLIVAAGMEGALPSVVSGLVSVPVIGLPTSTGYGLGGDGTAAILGMLQTCSPGLSVVNVDNGVGAGATAALIANRAAAGRKSSPD